MFSHPIFCIFSHPIFCMFSQTIFCIFSHPIFCIFIYPIFYPRPPYSAYSPIPYFVYSHTLYSMYSHILHSVYSHTLHTLVYILTPPTCAARIWNAEYASRRNSGGCCVKFWKWGRKWLEILKSLPLATCARCGKSGELTFENFDQLLGARILRRR